MPPAPEQACSWPDRAGPWRVSGSHRAWPLHDTNASRAHEAQALAHANDSLMERAGQAVARLALALWPLAHRVAVVCGPGNNGGDGLVAARVLHGLGLTVQLHHSGPLTRGSADREAAARAAAAAGLVSSPCPAALQADLVIDALLGLGARRAPADDFAQALRAIHASGAPVLAIDLPSGLHPDTGARLGDVAVAATATLSLLTLKPGCFTHEGRDAAGEVWLDTLGHPPPVDRASAWLAAPPRWARRPHASHKGRFGDVLVVGGASGMAGAAELAAGAALAAGAGRVYLSPLDPDARHARPELMVRPQAWLDAPPGWQHATVLAGCGGGESVAATLPPLLAQAAHLVLDADALNAVARDTMLATLLAARARRGQPSILTPHPLEAARLLGTDVAMVQSDRLAAAQSLASRFGATVLLKGSGTVIASPAHAAPTLNPTGSGRLATAGTGDVLAGWIAGRWSAEPGADAHRVACEAAWWHGHAADQAPGRSALPWRAADLIESMALGR